MTSPSPPLPVVLERELTVEKVLASQERLLRVGRATVHVASLGETAVSYGVGVRKTAPYLARAREDQVSVVPRASGGTGLVHFPGDLVWAVILPRADPRVGRGFVRAYDRFGQGLVDMLAARGISTRWVGPMGLSEDYCPLSRRGLVLDCEGRVLAAAAQHATGTTLLHAGSLSRTLDRRSVARWFGLPEPGPADRLTCLTEVGVHASPDELAHSLGSHLVAALQREV